MTIVSLPDSLISTLPGGAYADATIFAMSNGRTSSSQCRYPPCGSTDLDGPG